MRKGKSESRSILSKIALPLFVSLFFLFFGITVTALRYTHETEITHKNIQNITDHLLGEFERDFNQRIPILERMVKRWEFRESMSKEEFELDASNIYLDLPGFQAIVRSDSNSIAQWVVPLSRKPVIEGINLSSEENRIDAMELAQIHRETAITKMLTLKTGKHGFIVYFPIFIQNSFQGMVAAVFDIEKWIQYVFKNNNIAENEFCFTFFYENEEAYSDLDPSKNPIHDFSKISEGDILDKEIKILLAPHSSFLDANSTSNFRIAAFATVITTIAAYFITRKIQRANKAQVLAEDDKEILEREMEQRKIAEAEIVEMSERLSLAAKAGGIGIWIWDIKNQHLEWDKQEHFLYGLPANVPVGYENWKKMVHPDDIEENEKLFNLCIEGKASYDTSFRIYTPSGELRYIHAAALMKWDNQGNPDRLIGVNWDITDERRKNEQLETQRRRLAAIIEGTHVGTWEWNIQTGEVLLNEFWANIIGYTLSELEPISIETWHKFTHPEDLEKSNTLLQAHFDGQLNYYECEARMKHKSGRWIWIQDRGKVTSWTDDGKPLLMSGTHQDITAAKEYEERIRHMATHDALTGLPGLRLAKDRLRKAAASAMRRNSTVGIMFIDLDGFKEVNDTYGHDCGDVVLIEIARRLARSVRETDTAARIGGDEFLVIGVDLGNRKNAELLAEKIITNIARPIKAQNREIILTPSIGIALCVEHGTDTEVLLRKADQAMYDIKGSGKNGYAFAESNTED